MTLRLNNDNGNSASIDYVDGVSTDVTVTIPEVDDATFVVSDTDGNVEIDSRLGINTPPNADARLACNGTLASRGISLSSDITDINNTRNIQLSGNDGTAEFNGNVTINDDFDTSSNNGQGIELRSTGTLTIQRQNTDAGSTNTFRVFRGTSENVFIRLDGNATFAGTVTESGSDIKFKTQTRSLPTSQLQDVKNLQLKEWNWTEDAPGNTDRNERRNRGLIAQEAELVDPKLVYEVYLDEDNSYKVIDNHVLIFKLLGAIQELEAEVQALKGGAS